MKELSLPEIEMISKNMNNFFILNITGGEPFIRNDVEDIVNIFYRINHIQLVTIATNGFFTEKIVNSIKNMRQLCPKLKIIVTVSMDDMKENYDKLRGVKGAYEKAVETIKELKKIPEIQVGIICTYTKYNEDAVFDVYQYCMYNLKVDSFVMPIIRKPSKDKEAQDVNLSKYTSLIQHFKNDWKHGASAYKYKFSSLANSARYIALETIIKSMEQNRYMIPCYPDINCIIYPDSTIAPCENRNDRYGNLREFNYDFKKVWFSENAIKIRKNIKQTKCFCNACNFYVNNVLFNPKLLVKCITR
jgi:MoaA/NifB/PqqE/SkfB family radical SAM enzyme